MVIADALGLHDLEKLVLPITTQRCREATCQIKYASNPHSNGGHSLPFAPSHHTHEGPWYRTGAVRRDR